MCVRVRRATTVTEPWDAARQIITIPEALEGPAADIAVRGTLARLGIGQPPAGAVCWCGEPVHIDGTPAYQPDDTSEVIHRGA